MDYKNRIFKSIIYGGLFFSLAGNATYYYYLKNLKRELEKANDRTNEILEFSRELDNKKYLLEEYNEAIIDEKNELIEGNYKLETENYELKNWSSLLQMAYESRDAEIENKKKKVMGIEKKINEKISLIDEKNK